MLCKSGKANSQKSREFNGFEMPQIKTRTGLAEGSFAKKPTHAKTRLRFEKILDEAEKIVAEQGLSGFSIPVLAERLGFTRASIYHFFPSPFAVLNELEMRYHEDSKIQVIEAGIAAADQSWEHIIRVGIEQTAKYYNQHPVARMLLLGGLMSDDNVNIQEQNNLEMANVFRKLFATYGIHPPTEPDVSWIAIDIVHSVFSHSQYVYKKITDACIDEAYRASTAYIRSYIVN